MGATQLDLQAGISTLLHGGKTFLFLSKSIHQIPGSWTVLAGEQCDPDGHPFILVEFPVPEQHDETKTPPALDTTLPRSAESEVPKCIQNDLEGDSANSGFTTPSGDMGKAPGAVSTHHLRRCATPVVFPPLACLPTNNSAAQQADVQALRDQLELCCGSLPKKINDGRPYCYNFNTDTGCRRDMCAFEHRKMSKEEVLEKKEKAAALTCAYCFNTGHSLSVCRRRIADDKLQSASGRVESQHWDVENAFIMEPMIVRGHTQAMCQRCGGAHFASYCKNEPSCPSCGM
jgi:hypothetical protein